MHKVYFVIYVFIIFILPQVIFAQDELAEFKVKRKEVFDFTQKPKIEKKEDHWEIAFAVKDYCDVSVAIENKQGDIIYHLASGVLGDNAPDPFQKNTLNQKLIWNGKNDQGVYIDDLQNLQLRVSLGLKPEYEKDLYSSPYKQISEIPLLAAAPEGVYVFEGRGRDHLRLFDRKGNYAKTIYPFPNSQIKNVKGLKWNSFANREPVPEKKSIYHQTLLSSGNNDHIAGDKKGMTGKGASAMAVKDGRIALCFEHLNRLHQNGSSGELDLNGPLVSFSIENKGYGGYGSGEQIIGPSSLAFSPDKKVLYLTGYMWHFTYSGNPGALHGVMKIEYENGTEMQLFAGKNSTEDYGTGGNEFILPSSVDTDSNGNVYMSDFWNNRVQIFSPDAKLLKSIAIEKPGKVLVHQKTGAIYVFTYGIFGVPPKLSKESKYDPDKVKQKLTSFSAYPDCKQIGQEEFPFGSANKRGMFALGNTYQIVLDSWAENLTFWMVGKMHFATNQDIKYWGQGAKKSNSFDSKSGIRIISRIKDKWEVQSNFLEKASKDLPRIKVALWNVQNLYFNHKLKKLYLGEADSGPTGKAFTELIEIDSETNATKTIPLPFNPMDIAFDMDGLIYMRTINVLARYDMAGWREVPFDYGSEQDAVGRDGGTDGHSSPVISGVMLPATNAVCYHQGGLSVAPNGDIMVACHNRTKMESSPDAIGMKEVKMYQTYTPLQYPGRYESATSLCLHIWDKHGKQKQEDVVPGCPQTDGAFLDRDGGVYLMATPPRSIQGKLLDDGMSSTLFKFMAKKGRFLSKSPKIAIPLPKENYPAKETELRGMWSENNEWVYGGVGFGGFNANFVGGGCACWFARFYLDAYARSFAPEPMQYGVSVLDKNGNLILRIGKYGNYDSQGAKSLEPLGGDEVGLFHPCFVTSHTDKRLFIADIGNERIISVKLDYHINQVVSLLP